MATNPIEHFKENFRNVTGYTVDEAMQSLKTQNDVSARSGGNISMGDNTIPITGVGKKYGNVLKDAIKFYQDEFKVTPRANIIFDPDELAGKGLGVADERKDNRGQYTVNLLHLSDKDVPEAEIIAKEMEVEGVKPKNSNTISGVPVHELGHVLSFQLFPTKKDIVNLYKDALNDIGTDITSRKDIVEKTSQVSKYANADPYEAIAESLQDYYQNREKASPLARAVAKRMKNKGAMYGLTQSGGVGDKNETFIQNLRRYSAIQ